MSAASLKLRCCTTQFALKMLTWNFPFQWTVVEVLLLMSDDEDHVWQGVDGLEYCGSLKKVRYTKKTQFPQGLRHRVLVPKFARVWFATACIPRVSVPDALVHQHIGWPSRVLTRGSSGPVPVDGRANSKVVDTIVPLAVSAAWWEQSATYLQGIHFFPHFHDFVVDVWSLTRLA